MPEGTRTLIWVCFQETTDVTALLPKYTQPVPCELQKEEPGMVMGCFSNAKAFDVRAIINSITPTSGPSGTTLVISGSAYCNSQGSGCVYFGTFYVTSVTSWKQTQIKVKVPSGISGTVQVKVYTTGGMSNYKNFTKS